MSFLPFTILAYFLNAVAVTADKFLLKRFIPDPLVYIFYFSLFSMAILIFTPFVPVPKFDAFLLTSTSTILWTIGAYFMFTALKTGQASRVIPVIGTLTPILLFIHAAIFGTITYNQTWAVAFLILGLILLTSFHLKQSIPAANLRKEFIPEILASLSFAVSYLILRQAYLQENFLTVLVWGRMILLPLGVIILITPSFGKKILNPKDEFKVNFASRFGALFILGQIAGGLSQLLLTFSISLATPALVNSLQGTQYIFLLFFAYFLSNKFPEVFEEKTSPLALLSKVLGVTMVFIGLFILSFQPDQRNEIGISYSPLYASQLGLDPKITFSRLLEDTNVKLVRLPVYWNEAESFPKVINFGSTDYYLNEAQKRNVRVILVLGLKQPRWPECFSPEWVSKLTFLEKQKRILDLVQKEIDHFKSFPNIYAWQIENEPFLPFGVCDKPDSQTRETLKKEVQIIKAEDFRPILITDSGELSLWLEATNYGDIFGHTLYRHVWSPIFGTVEYPIPPIFYFLKGQAVRLLTLNPDKKIIISELQAEPWIPQGRFVTQLSPDAQAKLFPVSKLASAVSYAKETGAAQMYLWGVEWWYYMEKNSHPEYVQYIKKIFE